MKAALLGLFLLAGACDQSAPPAPSAALYSPGWPELTGRVVDRAELLSPEKEAELSRKSESLEKEVGPQFVIVTVPSLNGLPIEKYSIDLARHWGLGDKERNDGLMLLLAPSEHKVRIEVGYGLEKRVTDPFAAKVIREHMLPRFENGDFAAGIVEGSDALIERLRSKASDSEIAKADLVVGQ